MKKAAFCSIIAMSICIFTIDMVHFDEKNILGNTAEHAKGKALREDSIRQGIVGHSISDAGALI